MDFTSFIPKIAESGPFVLALLIILYYVWQYVQKKDQQIQDNQVKLMDLHERNITAQNQTATSHQQLGGAITQLKETICAQNDGLADGLKEIGAKIDRANWAVPNGKVIKSQVAS